MLTYGKAVSRRDQLQQELETRPRNQQRLQLLNLCLTEETTSEAQIDSVLAAMILIKFALERDLKEGLEKLQQAERKLSFWVEKNRRFVVFQRQLKVTQGNLNLRYGRPQDAIQCYQSALQGEQDIDRRALCLLNIARVERMAGRVFKALEIVQGVASGRMAQSKHAPFVHLLQSRILLELGYEQAAQAALPPRDAQSTKLFQIEHRYLNVLIEMDLLEPTGVAQFDQFVEKLRGEFPDQTVEYYELEGMIYRSFLPPKRLGKRQGRLARAKLLAEHTRSPQVLRLVRLLDQWLLGGEKLSWRVFAEVLLQAAEQTNLRLMQVVLIKSCARTIKVDAGLAQSMLTELQGIWQRLELGFDQETVRKLAQLDSSIRNLAIAFEEQIPSGTKKSKASIGDLLFPKT